jgi:hypothetical protein
MVVGANDNDLIKMFHKRYHLCFKLGEEAGALLAPFCF